MRHKWIDRHRTYGSWRSRCEKCGTLKDERFCYGTHWLEFQQPGGEWRTTDKTPPCVAVSPYMPKTEDEAAEAMDNGRNTGGGKMRKYEPVYR